nr:hypothetical protein [Streptomyces sp. HP-A2021]
MAAGDIGRNPARRLTALGHDAAVANSRSPRFDRAGRGDGREAGGVEEAARGACLTLPPPLS